jgi:hypothetical protein
VLKAEFLRAYGFPDEWLLWELYPDQLWDGQRDACADDEEPHPDEHLRYGAFTWWLRTHRALPAQTLKQLAHLAALDPDPPMSSAAAHDILFHPSATEDVADELARLAMNNSGWRRWIKESSPDVFFRSLLSDGRRFWRERYAAHRIASDIEARRLSVDDLRELYALASPLVMRGLVEHPNLPTDLLVELTKVEGVRFAKEIRTLARKRLENGSISVTGYREKYSTDPWLWPR